MKVVEVKPPVAMTFVIEIDGDELLTLGLAISLFRQHSNISEGRFNIATELQNALNQLMADTSDGKGNANV